MLLDGRDITDVPTDFSKAAGNLKYVFTQRPIGVFGVVIEDATQLPAEDASVVIFSEDPAQRQPWANSSQLLTDRLPMAASGRRCRRDATSRWHFQPAHLSTRAEAFRDLNAFEKLATPFTIDPERRGARVRLTLSRPPILRR